MSFSIMSHSALCRIRPYVVRDCVVQRNVALPNVVQRNVVRPTVGVSFFQVLFRGFKFLASNVGATTADELAKARLVSAGRFPL